MDVKSILEQAIHNDTSDIFIIAGLPLTFKIHSQQLRLEEQGKLFPEHTEALIMELYNLAGRSPERIAPEDADDDFSFALAGVGRFRVNVFHQRSSLAAVVRVIKFGIPDYKSMDIPEQVMSLTRLNQGIVLEPGVETPVIFR